MDGAEDHTLRGRSDLFGDLSTQLAGKIGRHLAELDIGQHCRLAAVVQNEHIGVEGIVHAEVAGRYFFPAECISLQGAIGIGRYIDSGETRTQNRLFIHTHSFC